MQVKSRSTQHGLIIDGIEPDGLNELSDLDVVKGETDAPYPGGVEGISTGQKKWSPITGKYNEAANSEAAAILWDAFNNNKLVDLYYVRRDGHGVEYERWLIADAECTKYTGKGHNSGSPENSTVEFRFVFDSAIKQ